MPSKCLQGMLHPAHVEHPLQQKIRQAVAHLAGLNEEELALGIDGLTASAIKGKNAMPPRGGSQGSDADIKAVVTYMVNTVK
jgi:cytochrome c5